MATQPKKRRLVTEETLPAQMADEFQGLLEDELPAALEAPAAAATLSVAIGEGVEVATGAGGPAVRKIGTDNGGQVLAPIRVPTLVVDDVYPHGTDTMEILWVDPDDKRYAYSRDNRIYTRTAAQGNWLPKGRIAAGVRPGFGGAFIKLRSNASPAKGALLCVSDETPRKVYRSTAASDGQAWSEVYTLPANHEQIGPTFFAEDQVTGYVYMAEYNGTDPHTMSVHSLKRSTDGGLTFAEFATLPGQAGGGPAATRVRHVHGVQWDPVGERIYYMTGDADHGGGIYRVNAAGTGIEKVVTNIDIGADPETGYYRATVINVAFTPNYLVWIHDQARGGVHALHRSKIGAATPSDVSLIYRPNSTGWFATRASSDNRMWVFSASNETSAGGAPLDKGVHLYALWEDDDEQLRCWEVAADKSEADSWAALAPVGQPEIHGDEFWLRRHSYGHNRNAEFRCRLTRGSIAALPQPDPIPPVYGWITRDTGMVNLTSATTYVFARTQAPSVTGVLQHTALRCFDFGLWKKSGTGAAKLVVWNVTKSQMVNETIVVSARNSQAAAPQLWYTTAIDPGDLIEFRLVETAGGGATWEGSGFVTYGFGEVSAR